uniref:Uncharacterized protein n=1 Tax=Tanacetum cinerariifolium TaxID=118510 RepID=A0A699R0W1_TANCI|nr:hypothetical protein [Tanacetum cinerariifolium]
MRNLSGSPSFSALSRSFLSLSLNGYGIDGFGLGFRALTGASTGSTTGLEFRGEEIGMNYGSLICNSTLSGDTIQIILRVSNAITGERS